jgi:hypothetical protein
MGGGLAYGLLTNAPQQKAAESMDVESAPSKDAEESGASQGRPDEPQAGRVEVEKKFEAPPVEETESAVATQQKLGTAEQPAAPAAAAPSKVQTTPSWYGTRDSGRKQMLKTGECSLVAGNVAALRDCVDKFNR